MAPSLNIFSKQSNFFKNFQKNFIGQYEMAAHKSHSPTRIFVLSQLLRKIWAFKKERFEVGHPVGLFGQAGQDFRQVR